MQLYLINLSFLVSNAVFVGKVPSPFFLAKTIYLSSPGLYHLSLCFLIISIKLMALGKDEKWLGRGSGQS